MEAVHENHPVLMQSIDAESIYKTPAAVPANAAMVKGMPALMAFYGRLRDKVFPDGPSENWVSGMFNPKERATATAGSSSNEVAGAGAT
jgi:hypothetical protein